MQLVQMESADQAPLINIQELEIFRVTLPTYRQQETFRFLFCHWDIVRALYLIHKYERPTGTLQVAGAARTYGLDREWSSAQDDAGVSIDPLYAMSDKIDLTRPVILALVDEQHPMLIDGLHRLYRAAQNHKEKISCYALSPEEEKLCRC